ncbi:MAG: 50S ribosomal protein L17 [bacterium]|nr:50S ribosomal protein L17 [bacterium]
MRHLKEGKKFGRERGQRKAFLKSLLRNLIQHERIMTTEIRAKELRRFIEPLVTRAKKQEVAALRLLISRLDSKSLAYKLYHEIAPRYANRKGGYTRIEKMALRRKNDGAPMAYIEFVK